MNKYYSKRTVLNYVSGYDIEDYDIDDLENNYLFMMDVIKYTKDKKMYDLCSENVKLNHEFVKFLIIMFQKDLDFIKKVSNYYLENRKPDINEYDVDVEHDEIIILMSNLNKNEDDEDYFYSHIEAFEVYLKSQMQIELFLDDEKDNKALTDALGLGFFLVIEAYGNNDIVLDFFAKKYLSKLFKEREDFELKRYLHQKFPNFEAIEKLGITNFFSNYIASYDAFLATYISTHSYLLDDLKKEMINIKKNWEYFETFLIEEKIDIIFENVKNYLNDNGIDDTYYYIEISYYVLKKLNLIDKLKDYNDNLEILDEDFKDNKEYYEMKFNPIIPTVPLKKHLKEIEEIIIKTLKNKPIIEENNTINIEEKQELIKRKAKILKFKNIKTN